MRPGCYNPSAVYKPQFAFRVPPGCRDETYLVPFTFVVPGDGSLVQGLPWSLDDDVGYIWRGLIFPQIGLNPPILNPGFCRIRDTVGNPLCEGLILSLGAWSESGWDENPPNGQGTAAFGFPIEPEIDCEPGGVLTFDFQLTTNALVASIAHAGIAETITFFAGVFGTAGNAWTIQTINPGAANVPLSIAVVGGNTVRVTLATDGGGVITSTFAQVAAAINAFLPILPGTPNGAGFAVISGAAPNEVITAFGPLAMAGGTASSPITLNGALIGVKRYREC